MFLDTKQRRGVVGTSMFYTWIKTFTFNIFIVLDLFLSSKQKLIYIFPIFRENIKDLLDIEKCLNINIFHILTNLIILRRKLLCKINSQYK